MSYRRPADYQIIKHYECQKCKMEQDTSNGHSIRMPCPSCGGYVNFVSESYPSNSDEWDEKRIGDINSSWINERTGKYLGHD
jgi:hypothetical protein